MYPLFFALKLNNEVAGLSVSKLPYCDDDVLFPFLVRQRGKNRRLSDGPKVPTYLF